MLDRKVEPKIRPREELAVRTILNRLCHLQGMAAAIVDLCNKIQRFETLSPCLNSADDALQRAQRLYQPSGESPVFPTNSVLELSSAGCRDRVIEREVEKA
jgi:hypothetical protein